MDIEALVLCYPRLFHMAEKDSWASIRRHGLLSTAAILDLLDVPSDSRRQFESEHRPKKVTVGNSEGGSFVLRDQKPMNDERLNWCLRDGLRPADWYRILNSKVFFWVSEQRLLTLLGARAYRDEDHDVLTIQAEPLIRAYADRIRLAHINTGNTFPYPAPRGLSTFKTIPEYPTKRDAKTPTPEIVELVVESGVIDIERYVIAVRRMKGPDVLELLYERTPSEVLGQPRT